MTETAAIQESLDPNSLEIVAIGWFITIGLAILGWIYNSHKNRQLQRKQIAISLLQDNRFEPLYVEAMHTVFNIVHNDSGYDWKSLATKYFGNGKLDEDQIPIMSALKVVLNYFELVAVAVLNKAASEDVIRWSYEAYYETFNSVLKDFLAESRRCTKDEEIWINITNLAARWAKKPSGAVPSD